jgi:hypothetical protein
MTTAIIRMSDESHATAKRLSAKLGLTIGEVCDRALTMLDEPPSVSQEGGTLTIDRAVLFAAYIAMYECLRILDTSESPLGFLADEARRNLRRAYVAMESPLCRELEHEHGWKPAIADRDGAIGEYHVWRRERAKDIAAAEFEHLDRTASQSSTLASLRQQLADALLTARYQSDVARQADEAREKAEAENAGLQPDKPRLDWLENCNAMKGPTGPLLPPSCGYSVRQYIDARLKDANTPMCATPTPPQERK